MTGLLDASQGAFRFAALDVVRAQVSECGRVFAIASAPIDIFGPWRKMKATTKNSERQNPDRHESKSGVGCELSVPGNLQIFDRSRPWRIPCFPA